MSKKNIIKTLYERTIDTKSQSNSRKQTVKIYDSHKIDLLKQKSFEFDHSEKNQTNLIKYFDIWQPTPPKEESSQQKKFNDSLRKFNQITFKMKQKFENKDDNQDNETYNQKNKTIKSYYKQDKLPLFRSNFPPESILQLKLKESILKSQNKQIDTFIDTSNYQFRDEVILQGQQPFITKFQRIHIFNQTIGKSQKYYLKNQWKKQRFNSEKFDKSLKEVNNYNTPSRNSVFYQRGYQLKPVVIN